MEIKKDGYYNSIVIKDGILDKVSQIFGIEKNDNNNFELTEHCDIYFVEELTKEELIQLGNELIFIANNYKDK